VWDAEQSTSRSGHRLEELRDAVFSLGGEVHSPQSITEELLVLPARRIRLVGNFNALQKCQSF